MLRLRFSSSFVLASFLSPTSSSNVGCTLKVGVLGDVEGEYISLLLFMGDTMLEGCSIVIIEDG